MLEGQRQEGASPNTRPHTACRQSAKEVDFPMLKRISGRLPFRGNGPWIVVAAVLVALLVTPFALAAGENRPVRGGARNPSPNAALPPPPRETPRSRPPARRRPPPATRRPPPASRTSPPTAAAPSTAAAPA